MPLDKTIAIVDYSIVTDRPLRDRSGALPRIALLGVLARRPAHGYDIKATLKRWDMHWWADIQSGSIYSGLRRLEAEGLVRLVETGQHGKRPPHRTYEITEAGREEFRDLLRQAWLGITRYSRPIDLAVSFYDNLDRAEIIDLLKQRLDNLVQLERAFHPELTPPLGNPAQRAVVDDLRDHERRLIAAEIDWTKQLLSRLKGSSYPDSYTQN
jgi:DNA-binding PadR family transcriptional regulator